MSEKLVVPEIFIVAPPTLNIAPPPSFPVEVTVLPEKSFVPPIVMVPLLLYIAPPYFAVLP